MFLITILVMNDEDPCKEILGARTIAFAGNIIGNTGRRNQIIIVAYMIFWM